MNNTLKRYLIPALVVLVGAGFIVIGIIDKEVAAVLTKAINICTECIGIG